MRIPPAPVLMTVSGLTALGVLAPNAAAQAASSQAVGRDGVCTTGEFCYSYNSGFTGSVSDFSGSIGDYGASQPTCFEFKGSGTGKDVCVKNNAAAAWNRTTRTVRVFYNSGYAGDNQDVAPGTKVNLKASLKNNNASHQFLGTSEAPTNANQLSGTLSAGQSVVSPNGVYRLYMNTDGDAEVRAMGSARAGIPQRLLWSTARACGCTRRLVMQSDGNLVLYQGGEVSWASNTDGKPGARLAVQNDGNVVIYYRGAAVWSSHTAHYQNWDDTVTYMLQEMRQNGADMAGRRKTTSVVKLGYFWKQERTNGSWDHKPKLRSRLGLTTGDSLSFEVRGLTRTASYYDYWSNLHYGYVGTLGEISSSTLLRASESSLVDNGDPLDLIAVRAGIDLAHRVGGDLTRQELENTVRASIRANPGTALNIPIAY